MKKIAVYIIVVGSFGTVLGLTNLFSGNHENAVAAFAYAYAFCAVLWGTIFIGVPIVKLSIGSAAKASLLFGASSIAAILAAFMIISWAPETASDFVRINFGGVEGAYKEYPIKGYQFIGACVFIAYLGIGLLAWLVSLVPQPEKANK